MNKKFLFTVITVVYNDSKNLENTILSISNQNFKSIQYIVIDGGSSDETLDILKKYSNNINIIISEADEGIYDAMNKGISLAEGLWINFLNAGDEYFTSNFLNELSLQITKASNNLVVTGFIIGNRRYSPILNKVYLLRNMLCHQSIFYKYELFEINRYSLRYKYCSDFNHLVESFYKLSVLKVDNLAIKYLGDGFSSGKRAQLYILNERIKIVLNSKFNLSYKVLFTIINRLQYFKNWLCSFL